MEGINLIWSKLIEFTSSNVKLINEGIAGTYRLSFKDESDGNYYVFYVGDSTDIKKSLLKHLNENQNTCILLNIKNKKCAFKYAKIDDEQIRKSATKQAYLHYQPSCNESEPEGDITIQINLT